MKGISPQFERAESSRTIHGCRELGQAAVFYDNITFHLDGALSAQASASSRIGCLMKLISFCESNSFNFSSLVASGRLTGYIGKALKLVNESRDTDVTVLLYVFVAMVCFDDRGQVRTSIPEKVFLSLLSIRHEASGCDAAELQIVALCGGRELVPAELWRGTALDDSKKLTERTTSFQKKRKFSVAPLPQAQSAPSLAGLAEGSSADCSSPRQLATVGPTTTALTAPSAQVLSFVFARFPTVLQLFCSGIVVPQDGVLIVNPELTDLEVLRSLNLLNKTLANRLLVVLAGSSISSAAPMSTLQDRSPTSPDDRADKPMHDPLADIVDGNRSAALDLSEPGHTSKLRFLQNEMTRRGHLRDMASFLPSFVEHLSRSSLRAEADAFTSTAAWSEAWLSLGLVEASCYSNPENQEYLASLRRICCRGSDSLCFSQPGSTDSGPAAPSFPSLVLQLVSAMHPLALRMMSDSGTFGPLELDQPTGFCCSSDDLGRPGGHVYPSRNDFNLFPELSVQHFGEQVSSGASSPLPSPSQPATSTPTDCRGYKGKRKFSSRPPANEGAAHSVSSQIEARWTPSKLVGAKRRIDCFINAHKTPPSVDHARRTHHEAMGVAPLIGACDLYISGIRVLLNLSHRCAPVCLDLCVAGVVELCATGLAAWFRCREKLKLMAAAGDHPYIGQMRVGEAQKQCFDCCLLLLNLLSNVLEVVPPAFICAELAGDCSPSDRSRNEVKSGDVLRLTCNVPSDTLPPHSSCPGTSPALGDVLLHMLHIESAEFMSTILNTEEPQGGLSDAPTQSSEAAVKLKNDLISIDGLVLCAHISLLLFVATDDSFAKRIYCSGASSYPTLHRSINLDDRDIIQSRFSVFMRARASRSVSAIPKLDHWAIERLPRRSWWLPIRLLSAFVALQGQIGVGKLESIEPILFALSRMKGHTSGDDVAVFGPAS